MLAFSAQSDQSFSYFMYTEAQTTASREWVAEPGIFHGSSTGAPTIECLTNVPFDNLKRTVSQDFFWHGLIFRGHN